MIIYIDIYKDNEVNLWILYNTEMLEINGKWQLSYMNDIIEVVIGNKI